MLNHDFKMGLSVLRLVCAHNLKACTRSQLTIHIPDALTACPSIGSLPECTYKKLFIIYIKKSPNFFIKLFNINVLSII